MQKKSKKLIQNGTCYLCELIYTVIYIYTYLLTKMYLEPTNAADTRSGCHAEIS